MDEEDVLSALGRSQYNTSNRIDGLWVEDSLRIRAPTTPPSQITILRMRC
jgi:hypothetical protein